MSTDGSSAPFPIERTTDWRTEDVRTGLLAPPPLHLRREAPGAHVELVEVEEGVVKVRLQGACAGCPMSQMTIKNGIERLLKQEIPEVKSVVSV